MMIWGLRPDGGHGQWNQRESEDSVGGRRNGGGAGAGPVFFGYV